MFKSKRFLEAEIRAANIEIKELRAKNERLEAENKALTSVKHCDTVTLCQNCKHGIKQLVPITFRTGAQQSGHVVCSLHTDNACKDFEMISSHETYNNR